MKIKIEELERLTRQAILNFGYTDAEAETILDVLLYAQLRGNNQGVVKLIGPGIPKSPSLMPISIEKETEISALIDGGNNHAMLVVNYAVELLLEKTKGKSIGIVGVNHLGTSSGAIGYYARRIAAEGLIGIVAAGAPPVVAAEGSYEPMFGTNPLSVALPSTGDPIVLDMSTSAMTFFGMIEAKTAGRNLPPDSAYDKDGKPTVDPHQAGALRTFDRGAKGSGLSFIIQALAGPLIGASFLGTGDVTGNWGGHLLLAIDPELFQGVEVFRAGVSAMVQKVKAAKRLPGVDEILVPGERGDRRNAFSRGQGDLEMEDNLYKELKRVSERVETPR